MKEFAKSPTTSQDINNFLDKKFAGKTTENMIRAMLCFSRVLYFQYEASI